MSWYTELSKNEQGWIRKIDQPTLENSLIIDFEGPISGPPELAGVYHDNGFSTHFFSPVFKSCLSKYENSQVDTFEEFCKWIDFMVNEGYKVIAFSTLEGETLLPHMSNKNISHWYRDAHKYFKRHPTMWRGYLKPRPFDLSGVLTRLAITERQYGNRQASQRIKHAKQQLTDGRTCDELTPTAKAKLTKVIRYNQDDVCCLRDAIIASFDID
ncbi:hypothetical protein N8Z74_00640 [Schleiferiaceae bacterium]|nr:hypothetical protein [Schleiferiaceae bacterium]|tara:strand:+ start:119 stop:757 length:639 start_codon:yes stop_codon:yes gene_type:complete